MLILFVAFLSYELKRKASSLSYSLFVSLSLVRLELYVKLIREIAASGDSRGEVWRFRLRNARVQRARQTRKVAKPCLATVVVATSEASAGSSPAGRAKKKAQRLGKLS